MIYEKIGNILEQTNCISRTKENQRNWKYFRTDRCSIHLSSGQLQRCYGCWFGTTD